MASSSAQSSIRCSTWNTHLADNHQLSPSSEELWVFSREAVGFEGMIVMLDQLRVGKLNTER